MNAESTVAAISFRDVSKNFGEVPALDRLNVSGGDGETLTLLGPSGCGKTTALRLLAGFDRPDFGVIEIGGKEVVSKDRFVPAEKRKVGMVFQDYALFPHLDVAANVGFGLPKRVQGKGRVAEVLELVGLEGVQARFPHQLSGGQQQRVALARALAPAPEVVLLDEPFSNLDAALRGRVRREVASILRGAGTTTIFVTHDQEEALAMSDRVAVMRAGRVIQVDTPDRVYQRPTDPWVASFLGDADFYSGRADGGKVETVVGIFPSDIDGPVEVMVRPESVSVFEDGNGELAVEYTEFFGHDQLLIMRHPSGKTIRSRRVGSRVLSPGTRVRIEVSEGIAYPSECPADLATALAVLGSQPR